MIISSTGFWDGKKAHLVGHRYSFPLVNWIIEYLKDQKDKQIYDFGCGIGQYLQKLNEAGFKKLTGFEGDIPINRAYNNILQQDLAKPFTLLEKGNCLWLEVAEHIPDQYIDIAINNISNACDNKLIMSWAVRGQGGLGHVNCLNNDEAIEKIIRYGFVYLEEDTMSVRKNIDPNKADMSNGDLPWFANTTLIFKKV
jgi:SAM-dependent methyltransferase